MTRCQRYFQVLVDSDERVRDDMFVFVSMFLLVLLLPLFLLRYFQILVDVDERVRDDVFVFVFMCLWLYVFLYLCMHAY